MNDELMIDVRDLHHAYALGAVADWLHRTVAGLAPAEFSQGERFAHEASISFRKNLAHGSWPFQRRSRCTSLSSSVASLKCMYTVAKRR